MKINNFLITITLCGCSLSEQPWPSAFNDIVHVDKPFYPEEAFHNKKQGFALVKFDIDNNGATYNIRVHSTPDILFEEAAREAVSKWRYKKDSPKVDVQVRLVFELNN